MPSKRNKNGYTLIELVIIIAVIAIIAVISIPQIVKFSTKAEMTVCNENRGIVLRMYKIRLMYDPDADFEAFLLSEYGDKELCPKNGEYTYESGKITCSYHKEESDGYDDPSIIDLPDGNQITATSSWAEVMEIAASSAGGGVSVQKGSVYYDETGYYIMLTPEWVPKNTVLSEYSRAVKLKTDSILTSDDIISVYSPTWKEGIYLTKGTVRLHTDGSYYAYTGVEKDAGGTWAGIDATWLKLTSM